MDAVRRPCRDGDHMTLLATYRRGDPLMFGRIDRHGGEADVTAMIETAQGIVVCIGRRSNQGLWSEADVHLLGLPTGSDPWFFGDFQIRRGSLGDPIDAAAPFERDAAEWWLAEITMTG